MKKILSMSTQVLSGAIIGFLFLVGGLILGMIIGGNWININYAGLRGYESLGLIGAVIGEGIGIVLGMLLAKKFLKNNLSLGKAVAGSVVGVTLVLIIFGVTKDSQSFLPLLIPLFTTLVSSNI